MKPWALLAGVLLVAGCAAPGGVERAGLVNGSRVGILNLMGPSPSHFNFGANQLGDFEKRYRPDLQLQRFVLDELRRQLRVRYAYVLVVSETPAASAGVGRSVMKPANTGLADAVVSGVQRFARDNQLEHVLVIGEFCDAVPPPRRGLKCGYGLYTDRAATGSGRAFAYFNVAVFRVSPLGVLLQPLTQLPPAQTVVELPSFQIADVEHVTPEEWRPVDAALRTLAARRIEDSGPLVK
jgi:hypothetical protein